MKDQRNRFKLYPAPKPTISAEAFKKAVVSRKRAEALAHVQAQAAALERLQVSTTSAQPGQHAAGNDMAYSNGHTEGLAHPQDTNGLRAMSPDAEPAHAAPQACSHHCCCMGADRVYCNVDYARCV